MAMNTTGDIRAKVEALIWCDKCGVKTHCKKCKEAVQKIVDLITSEKQKSYFDGSDAIMKIYGWKPKEQSTDDILEHWGYGKGGEQTEVSAKGSALSLDNLEPLEEKCTCPSCKYAEQAEKGRKAHQSPEQPEETSPSYEVQLSRLLQHMEGMEFLSPVLRRDIEVLVIKTVREQLAQVREEAVREVIRDTKKWTKGRTVTKDSLREHLNQLKTLSK